MPSRRTLLRRLAPALAAGAAGCASPLSERTRTHGSGSPTGDDAGRSPTATLSPPSSPTGSPTTTQSPTPTPTPKRTPEFDLPAGVAYAVLERHRSFGTAVALTADEAVVGEPLDGGSVHAFTHTPQGWPHDATLSTGEEGRFGRALAAADDSILVGTPRSDPAGSAHVFDQTDDGWVHRAELEPWVDDPDGFREFGNAVAYDGTVAVVGETGPRPGPQRSLVGAVYVFERTADGWTNVTRLGTEAHDMFGHDVALSGNRLLVGAPMAVVDDERTGAVYVYERSEGEWVRRTRLTVEGTGSDESFGTPLVLDGTTAIVGAPGTTPRAVAYAFERTDGEWRLQARLTPGSEAGGDLPLPLVGIAYDDDVAVVGVGDGPEGGHVYTFERGDGRWRRRSVFTRESASEGEFGRSVAFEDGVLLVGSPDTGTTDPGPGATFVFEL